MAELGSGLSSSTTSSSSHDDHQHVPVHGEEKELLLLNPVPKGTFLFLYVLMMNIWFYGWLIDCVILHAESVEPVNAVASFDRGIVDVCVCMR